MPVLLETGLGDANHARLAVDADGNAAVVWEQRFGEALYVWTSSYSGSRGWTAPEQVSGAAPTSQTTQPHVQLYGGGNVLVVWTQSNEIWSRTRKVDGSWLPAELLTRAEFRGFFADEHGEKAVLMSASNYYEETDAGMVSRVSWLLERFDPDLGWHQGSLPFADVDNAENVRVLLDGADGYTVLWTERNLGTPSASFNLWAQRNRANGTWEAPVSLRMSASIAVVREVVSSVGDHRIVSWTESDLSLWAAAFSPEDGWSTAERVVEGPAEGETAVGADGSAILLWRGLETVFATHYSRRDGWKPETRISSEAVAADKAPTFVDDDLLPRMRFLPDGSAVAVWPSREDPANYNGRHDIWSSVYSPDSGWQTPNLLEQFDDESAREVQLAASASGAVFAIWAHLGSNGRNLWVSRFD